MSLFVKMQPYAPLRFSTWCFGTLARIKIPFIKNYFIRKCIRKYDVNMDEVLNPDINSYENFNAFFSRRLKPEARTWAPAPALPSPVDGFISQIGKINHDSIIQAKGLDYTVEDLLVDKALAERFTGGDFATLYLSPRDYHRVHMPMDASLTAMTFVHGKYFSVNPETVDYHPKLFARNERLVCHFETQHGPMVIVLVGALNVSSMFTTWENGPIRHATLKTTQYQPPKPFKRGDEMGGFLMGSTAILLFPKGMIEWDKNLQPLQAIKMGQRLGEAVK
jgi:phosphatidylserine decarboxylase